MNHFDNQFVDESSDEYNGLIGQSNPKNHGNRWKRSQSGIVFTLTVAANAVAIDLSQANNYSLSLQATTSQVLSNPTNATPGQSGQIAILQNATPSILTVGSSWKPTNGTVTTVSTTANADNLITYYVASATLVWYFLHKGGVT